MTTWLIHILYDAVVRMPLFFPGGRAQQLEEFRGRVKAGGIWDFKSYLDFTAGYCPTRPECNYTVTLCGKCFILEIVGNIFYGAMGNAMGIGREILKAMAARAQAGGVDEPQDAAAIDLGVDLMRTFLYEPYDRRGKTDDDIKADMVARLCQLVSEREVAISVPFGEVGHDREWQCAPCSIPYEADYEKEYEERKNRSPAPFSEQIRERVTPAPFLTPY